LVVRTPGTTLLDEPVRALTAEDASGRFGVRPGSDEILAGLIPGILCYRAGEEVETVIAVGAGVLHARRDRVDVLVEEATLCGSIETAETALAAVRHQERGQRAAMRDLFDRLQQNLVRALAQRERDK
jgi:F-type H+-transporting ATPase subunit epsilon